MHSHPTGQSNVPLCLRSYISALWKATKSSEFNPGLTFNLSYTLTEVRMWLVLPIRKTGPGSRVCPVFKKNLTERTCICTKVECNHSSSVPEILNREFNIRTRVVSEDFFWPVYTPVAAGIRCWDTVQTTVNFLRISHPSKVSLRIVVCIKFNTYKNPTWSQCRGFTYIQVKDDDVKAPTDNLITTLTPQNNTSTGAFVHEHWVHPGSRLLQFV